MKNVITAATLLDNVRGMLDEDGENLAVRSFLMLYGGTNSPSTKQMRNHLSASGFAHWPEWVSYDDGHLTKGGAQDWIRHLFALEATLLAAQPNSNDLPDGWKRSADGKLIPPEGEIGTAYSVQAVATVAESADAAPVTGGVPDEQICPKNHGHPHDYSLTASGVCCWCGDIPKDVVMETLQRCVDDPMWADHAEVSKKLLSAAIALLAAQPNNNHSEQHLNMLTCSYCGKQELYPSSVAESADAERVTGGVPDENNWAIFKEVMQHYTGRLGGTHIFELPAELFERVKASAAAPQVGTPPEEKPSGAVYGIIDPDYGRIFTIIRKLAWDEGYAIGLHGSFTRDLDMIAVPWAERRCEPEHLIRRIVNATGLNNLPSNPGAKPHGRLVWTLMLPEFGDPRFVDLSIMPIAAPLAEDKDAALLDWLERKLFDKKWDGTLGRKSDWFVVGSYRHVMQRLRGETLREAITAAMKEANQ